VYFVAMVWVGFSLVVKLSVHTKFYTFYLSYQTSVFIACLKEETGKCGQK